MGDSTEIRQLKECQGREAREKLLAGFFSRHEARLRALVKLRLHPRLRGRMGASDVIQEAFLEAAKKLPAYLRQPAFPFFLWLRRITADTLHEVHRQHLGAKIRDARLEVPLRAGRAGPLATSATLASHFAKAKSPSDAAIAAERRATLEAAIEKMNPVDREILALRCFEQLSGREAAQVLGVKVETARQRYWRALKKLREILGDSGGLSEGSR